MPVRSARWIVVALTVETPAQSLLEREVLTAPPPDVLFADGFE